MKRLPDFIIIGAMKCATSTLHDQLAAQSGIFMSTPKEPNFFSDDQRWKQGVKWYGSLFEEARKNDICGESSTHYTKLPDYPETVERMHQYLPDIKLIYVMRHPIDRLISHYIHEWTERTINVSLDKAVYKYKRLIQYGLYSAQLEPYIQMYGKYAILPVFFERLVASPETELQRVCDFLDYKSVPVWNKDLSTRNVSKERLRKNAFRDAFIWNPAVTWVRRKVVPQNCRDWIKSFWQITEKPVLHADIHAFLETQFNQDLAVLGNWLNADLDCKNLKSVVANTPLDWSAKLEAA